MTVQDRVNKVFVYGTLKRGFPRARMLENSRFVGNDTVRGYLLTANWGYPALILEEKAPLVHGEVFIISNETRAALDQIEGVPHLYHRLAVRTFNNNIAWAYLMPQTSLKPSVQRVISTGDWKGAEGGCSLVWFLNEHPTYCFPRVPKMIYEQAVGCMAVVQNYSPELIKEQTTLPRDPTVSTSVIVSAPPKVEEPPFGDEDMPMPGVGIEWADKPGKAYPTIISNKTEMKDSGI